MNTITKQVVLLLLCFVVSQVNAQDSIQKTSNQYKIETLNELKEIIKKEEREFLKTEVEAINQRLEQGELTNESAEKLKKEAAKKRALNIENRLAIVDNKIALIKRNDSDYILDSDNTAQFNISINGDDSFSEFRIGGKNKPRKYDKRTTSDLVFAIGFNNALVDGESIGDTYNFLESGFIELGFAWKTRVFENSNTLRLKYGFSFQWNKLTIKDDKYYVQDGNITTLESFPSELRDSQLRITNLVVPIHFEFGPSKKIEKKNYFRYSTYRQIKFGIGGYAGFNIGTQQKLQFKEDGDKVKQKIRRNYNASPFVYGLSAYLGYGSVGLYVKYDLNTVFKDQQLEQNNLSMGFRFDLD
ncbi:hypothetical protein A9Q87_06330 [Flavobacteriales bacterium 34_180_T64]|nr:hypothetical protein A9Q87_06330 [Flavobacteriales bacterium 34_180_T64]